MGLFDKKYCDICGEKIGLLGNRKLENGNLCKNCARKLSPWFDDRRHSTVDEIKRQLDYREENRGRAAQFSVTRSMGERTKVLLDEDHGWMTVTSERDLAEANPDVVDFADITGCRVDVDEDRTELKREDKDGNRVSYNPPRYEYSYRFYIVIHVRNPYFDEMKFRLNDSEIRINHASTSSVGRFPSTLRSFGFDPMDDAAYRHYQRIGEEICEEINKAREQGSHVAASPAQASARPAPQTPPAPPISTGPWACPACGAENGGGKFCEFCGAARP